MQQPGQWREAVLLFHQTSPIKNNLSPRGTILVKQLDGFICLSDIKPPEIIFKKVNRLQGYLR